MNTLFNLVKKELRELLTPSTLATVIVVMILFIAIGSFLGNEVAAKTSVQPLGYYDDDGGTYSTFAIEQLKVYCKEQYKVDPDKYVINLKPDIGDQFTTDKLLKAMNGKSLTSAYYFPKGFNEKIDTFITKGEKPKVQVYYNQSNTGIASVINEVTTVQGLSLVNNFISAKLIEKYSSEAVPPQVFYEIMMPTTAQMATFFNGKLHENVTPDQIMAAMNKQTMFVPLIMMVIIVMIGSIVISSIGNEKENKTMETLLTLPVKRTTVVTGKLLGAAIAGLVMGAFYMIGMYFFTKGVQLSISGNVSMESLGLTLDALDWVIIAVMMFLAILCALGLCMILGAFAKNYKAAQMYVLPISVLAIIPMFVTMFSDFSQLPEVFRAVLFAIPFTHPMMVMQNLMFDNMPIVIGGLVYLAIFTVVTIIITVKLYDSDILITGLVRKDKRKGLFSKN